MFSRKRNSYPYIPVQVDEETNEEESQLDPSLALTSVQFGRIHDLGRVVNTNVTHHRASHVSETKYRNLTPSIQQKIDFNNI